MVRICTWNLENLFLPGDAAGPETGAAYQAKLSSLADVIATMAPDVLAVQEVGDEAALTDLAERVGGTRPRRRPTGGASGSASCPASR